MSSDAPNKQKTSITQNDISDCLNALETLQDGWNSYSAPAPSRLAIDNARALVKEAETVGTAPERVEPSAMGGVGVTFAFGHREIVIEFYNNGTAHSLFSDEASGGMRTEAVPTNPDGYQAVIIEVRKFLYGE